jgi:hypothetical protein
MHRTPSSILVARSGAGTLDEPAIYDTSPSAATVSAHHADGTL